MTASLAFARPFLEIYIRHCKVIHALPNAILHWNSQLDLYFWTVACPLGSLTWPKLHVASVLIAKARDQYGIGEKTPASYTVWWKDYRIQYGSLYIHYQLHRAHKYSNGFLHPISCDNGTINVPNQWLDAGTMTLPLSCVTKSPMCVLLHKERTWAGAQSN